MTAHKRYDIEWTETAADMLAGITDQRIREEILDRVERLEDDPEKQGKPLTGPLKGYRSLRASAQRYRIIYRVERRKLVVLVVGTGIRREGSKSDIYARIQRLLR